MLDVSRIMSGKLQIDIKQLDIVGVINAAVDGVSPAANAKRIDLQVHFEDELTKITGDPDRLQQIVWNLLSNAVKFTPTHGTIEVIVARAESGLQISVEDSGMGIASEHLSQVFERFRQVDSSTTRTQGGLGLGLAIVRQLVELHGGSVRAESHGLGKGTKFTLCLPVRAVGPENVVVPKASESGTELGPRRLSWHVGARLDGLRIVVVDDDEDSREIIRATLEEAGATVVKASSARPAKLTEVAAKTACR